MDNLILKQLTPLSQIVNAAIMDTHEDKGKVEQSFYHWGARGIKKLNQEVFKSIYRKRRVFLTVNKNTNTATLPPDFDKELFVGYINRHGYKIPLKHNSDLVNVSGIEEIECDDKCPKCNSSVSPCNDLKISIETKTVTINGNNYDQVITKRMKPNGDYFLESYIPYLDASGNVIHHTSNEFITNIDLKPCGCIIENAENINKIRVCNPDVYCRYYAPYASVSDNGEYNIFPETGLIQLSPSFPYNRLYFEYSGFLIKINGQYQVPTVAFETLVEWIKYKNIDGRKSVSRLDKNDQYSRYRIEKSNLEIVMTRTSLSRIINAVLTTPKFDVFIDREDYHIVDERSTGETLPVTDDCSNDSTGILTNTTGTSSTLSYVPLVLGKIVGTYLAPKDGTSSWQDNSLIGALNLNILHLNDTTYTSEKGDFTFDNKTGTIDIFPNKFYDGDVLVGNYFKLI